MMHIWGLTDIGLVRKDNQDAYATDYHSESDHMIAVVCDGMGGCKGGRVASRMAVDTYLAEIKKILRPDMTEAQLKQASSYAVALANDAVYEKAQEVPEYHGMGTTLVSAVSFPGGVVVSNVGDSRAYHISHDGIRCITKDHSLVEELLERGDITEEEARVHPNRNVITRALGSEEAVEADYFEVHLHSGDFLLLCSDGLSNIVSDLEMLEYAKEYPDPELLCQSLMRKALNRGARDNVTVLAVMK